MPVRTMLALALCTLLASLGACGKSPPPPAPTAPDAPGAPEPLAVETGPLRLAATIPPLEWIARGLAPGDAEVSVLLTPGASEHGYEPPPSRIASFVRADVVLMVGMGLEPAADRALRAAPRGGRAVVVFAEIAQVADTHAHAAHDNTDPNHEGVHNAPDAPALDPHLWLDPPRMEGMVNAAHDAIVRQLTRRAAPESELEALALRRDSLLAEVHEIDGMYHQGLAPFPGATLVTAHDSMRRLAARYGLHVAGAIHAHEGAEPTPGALHDVVAELRTAEHRAILVEPQSGRAVAERLAQETGAPLVEFDPLGSWDWPATMRTNLDALIAGLTTSR